MRILTPLPWALVLVACQNSSAPTPVENFVAMVDAQAAVQQLQYQQQQKAGKARLARLTQSAWVSENDPLNILYSPGGTVIYRGGPASMSELVWLSAAGGAEQVDAVTSRQGTYVAFTPGAIYVFQPASGSSAKLLRSRVVPARAGSAAPKAAAGVPDGASAAPAPASSAAKGGHFNTLRAIPQETPTSPSTEV